MLASCFAERALGMAAPHDMTRHLLHACTRPAWSTKLAHLQSLQAGQMMWRSSVVSQIVATSRASLLGGCMPNLQIPTACLSLTSHKIHGPILYFHPACAWQHSISSVSVCACRPRLRFHVAQQIFTGPSGGAGCVPVWAGGAHPLGCRASWIDGSATAGAAAQGAAPGGHAVCGDSGHTGAGLGTPGARPVAWACSQNQPALLQLQVQSSRTLAA